MGIKENSKIHIEELINAEQCAAKRNSTNLEIIHKYKEDLDKELEKVVLEEFTFYQEVCQYIRNIKIPSFMKPYNKIRVRDDKFDDADIDAPKFYLYAYIDKNTWSNIRNGRKQLSKESALKLVIALQLSEEQANQLLRKVSMVLNNIDYRDQIVIALLKAHCYDPDEASMVLEWYSKNGKVKFENIYEL